MPRVRAKLIHWLAAVADGCGPGSTERTENDAVVFDLVLAELPSLLRFLEDPDPETRRAVVSLTPLAALVGEDVGDRLARRHEEDPDGMVRADALSALAALRSDAVRRWAAEALTDPEPLVREGAAVLLLEEAGTPYPADLVEVLAEASAHPPPRNGLQAFLAGLPDPASRTVRVLDADAGVMALVARRSIAAGDHGRQGTQLAWRLASTWRDREEEAFALLVSALPYGGRHPERDPPPPAHLGGLRAPDHPLLRAPRPPGRRCPAGGRAGPPVADRRPVTGRPARGGPVRPAGRARGRRSGSPGR